MKAVFFDIDGTLWNYDKYIPESTREAIRLLRANGHKALLCSGRARAFIQDPDLLGLGFDGIVCSCGCHIEFDGKMIYEKLLTADEAKEVLDITREHGFKPIFEGPQYLYMDDSEFPVGDGFGDILRRDVGENLLQITGNETSMIANKLSCDMTPGSESRQECYDRLTDKFSIIEHNPFVCEIVPKGHTKATGMEKACQLLGIDMADTFAVGDSENDLDMLSAAGTGIAMGNGTDNAKAVADYVTTAMDDDGIFNALRHFGLI